VRQLGRLLHGQIRRLRTLENPAAVDADLAECVGPVRSVAHQPASCGKGAVDVDRRQTWCNASAAIWARRSRNRASGAIMRAPARTLRGAGKGCFKLADGAGLKSLDLR